MSAQVHVLVEYQDGKPDLSLGYGYTLKARAFQVKGQAEGYAKRIVNGIKSRNEYWAERIAEAEEYAEDEYYRDRAATWRKDRIKPIPDIRILTVSIPDDGELQDGIFPSLLAVPAASWS